MRRPLRFRLCTIHVTADRRGVTLDGGGTMGRREALRLAAAITAAALKRERGDRT